MGSRTRRRITGIKVCLNGLVTRLGWRKRNCLMRSQEPQKSWSTKFMQGILHESPTLNSSINWFFWISVGFWRLIKPLENLILKLMILHQHTLHGSQRNVIEHLESATPFFQMKRQGNCSIHFNLIMWTPMLGQAINKFFYFLPK